MILSIISINYNHKELTARLMTSLYKYYQREFENGAYEYIVVDNDSEDKSLEFLKEEVKKYKNFHVIANKKNTGFGAGNNLGAKHAKGNYLLFLNNDTQVQNKSFIFMIEFLESHKDADFLGGELVNIDGKPQVSAGKFYSPISFLFYMLGMQRFGLIDKNPKIIQQVDWVKGACMMVRKDVFEKLHGFDERIFMYTEDMELCYRAKRTGSRIWFYPNTKILHADQGSSNRTFAIVNIYKNMIYFYKKHRPVWEYILVRFILQAKARILILIGKICHNVYLQSTYEEALKSAK